MRLLPEKLKKNLIAIVLVLAFLLGGSAYIGWYSLFREVPLVYETPEDHFKYGSIGAENNQGIPYWVWLVLPRLFPEKLPQPGGYTALGITWEPGHETPVGFTKKTLGFPRTAINCATCHTATFRKTNNTPPTIIPTGPSSKFDLQGYIRFLSDCANDPRFTSGYLLKAIGTEYELSWLDKLLYRFIVIPQTRKELLRQQKEFAWMDTRPNWGAGRIDPFNPVKFRTLGLALDNTIGNSDMMPIWNQKQHKGFALHWDGLETSLTETVQTGAIGDGATRKSIDLDGLERVQQYITQLDPPKFPFEIDRSLADKGKPIFEQSCAACHAFGGKRTGTVIPLVEIGTDRHRLDMWTQEAADTYNDYAEGYAWDFDQLRKTDGYVAVSLDGLWLRAPYLHNGSVPSLTDLFEKPENRTPLFYRGYDVYDPKTVGFIAQGPEAKRLGFKYETQIVGNSNQGHLYGTDLSQNEKKALIEYLKTF